MPVSGGPRKRIRLPLESYLVPGTGWLVTIGTKDRTPVFADQTLGLVVTDAFRARSAARGVILDAFCLMLDHAHLLVQITSGGAGLVDLIGDLKSCSTRAWWTHGQRGQYGSGASVIAACGPCEITITRRRTCSITQYVQAWWRNGGRIH